jgi:outer membrane protein assembly factor BamB
MLGLLGWLWLAPMPSEQSRVLPTFPTLFFGVLFLFLWLILFSRLSRRIRRRIALTGVAVTLLVLAALEIKGVDGNLVPIVGFRPRIAFWRSGDRDFDRGDAGVLSTRPGPTDYPQFYGPDRDATLPGPALARDWSESPPQEIWRREVGEGWSGFAVVGDAAVTQEQRGAEEVVACYHRATGDPIWVHSDRARYESRIAGVGPRATPTLADGAVYTLGATGILNRLDLATGRRHWTVDVLADNAASQPDWGMPSSPLVVDDLVVVQLGSNGTLLAAYDRETGERAWRTGSDRGSYSSPNLVVLGGREQIVSVNARSVSGHHPATGEMLWSEDWPQPGERVTPALRLADDLLLVSAGYGVGSRVLRVTPAGARFAVDEVWESRRLKSKFASMVARHATVFGLDDGVLVALDPQSGERLWKSGRYGHGQLLLVADLLLVQAENGEAVLVEASAEEHRELGRLAVLSGKTWNPPALSGDLLLVRNDREAACYRLPLAE